MKKLFFVISLIVTVCLFSSVKAQYAQDDYNYIETPLDRQQQRRSADFDYNNYGNTGIDYNKPSYGYMQSSTPVNNAGVSPSYNLNSPSAEASVPYGRTPNMSEAYVSPDGKLRSLRTFIKPTSEGKQDLLKNNPVKKLGGWVQNKVKRTPQAYREEVSIGNLQIKAGEARLKATETKVLLDQHIETAQREADRLDSEYKKYLQEARYLEEQIENLRQAENTASSTASDKVSSANSSEVAGSVKAVQSNNLNQTTSNESEEE